jgi:hypothetical protein
VAVRCGVMLLDFPPRFRKLARRSKSLQSVFPRMKLKYNTVYVSDMVVQDGPSVLYTTPTISLAATLSTRLLLLKACTDCRELPFRSLNSSTNYPTKNWVTKDRSIDRILKEIHDERQEV